MKIFPTGNAFNTLNIVKIMHFNIFYSIVQGLYCFFSPIQMGLVLHANWDNLFIYHHIYWILYGMRRLVAEVKEKNLDDV